MPIDPTMTHSSNAHYTNSAPVPPGPYGTQQPPQAQHTYPGTQQPYQGQPVAMAQPTDAIPEVLPPGWTSAVDPASGATYYVDPNQQTSWERPGAVVPGKY